MERSRWPIGNIAKSPLQFHCRQSISVNELLVSIEIRVFAIKRDILFLVRHYNLYPLGLFDQYIFIISLGPLTKKD